MSKEKKLKCVVLVAVLLSVALFILYLTTPIKAFPDLHKIEFIEVYQSNGSDYIDITDTINLEMIQKAVTAIYRNRIRTRYGGWMLSDISYKICFLYNEKPYDIILGTHEASSIDDRNALQYKIQDASFWVEFLNQLIDD